MKERKLWTKQQDQALMFFKEKEGIDKWCEIAKRMKLKFGKNARNQKQCRDRYVNHLRIKNIGMQWNRDDQQKIIDLHKKLGNKWVAIAQHFDGTTEIFIKNQFYSRLRKSIRKLNKHINQSFRKEFKEFKLNLAFKLTSVVDGKLNKLNQIKMGLSQAFSRFLYVLLSFTSNSVSRSLAEKQLQENFASFLIRPLVSFEKIFNLLNKTRNKRFKDISTKTAFTIIADHQNLIDEKKATQTQHDSKIIELSKMARKELDELTTFEEKYLLNGQEIINNGKNKATLLTKIQEQKMHKKISSVSQLFKQNSQSDQNHISKKQILEEENQQNLFSECNFQEDATSVVEEESFIIDVLYDEQQSRRSMLFGDDGGCWANQSQQDFGGWEG